MNVKNPVVVVTGASSGTGAAAARQLRSGGAEVVVVGRDPTRTHALADELGVRGSLGTSPAWRRCGAWPRTCSQ